MVLIQFVRSGGYVACAWFGYLSIKALAGHTTLADISVMVGAIVEGRTSEVLAWLFGTAGVSYGYYQRKLRRDVTERLASRTSSLEGRIDRRRSSSRLTTRGETPPGEGP